MHKRRYILASNKSLADFATQVGNDGVIQRLTPNFDDTSYYVYLFGIDEVHDRLKSKGFSGKIVI